MPDRNDPIGEESQASKESLSDQDPLIDDWPWMKNHIWEEIKGTEQKLRDDNEKPGAVAYQLSLLDRLIWGGVVQKDSHTLAKAFYKYIELGKTIETIDQIKPKFPEIQSPVFTLFENYIGQALKHTGYQDEVVIRHPKMVKAFTEAISYSFDNSPCLIIGETGTGKELISRCMHFFSNRRRRNNFRAINCGGFTETLFNSEIQGHTKGAFTDASSARLGVFLSACGRVNKGKKYGYIIDRNQTKFRKLNDNCVEIPNTEVLKEFAGTVFLDEINSLPISKQPALLRIIQENEVKLIGDSLPKPFIAKVICATNADPLPLIKKGELRSDLFFRISRGIVNVPPLREMKDCFEELVNGIVVRLWLKEIIGKIISEEAYQKLGNDKKVSVSSSAMKELKKYNWPGNIRELENVLYQGLIRMKLDGGFVLKKSHLENILYIPDQKENKILRDYGDAKFEEIEKEYLKYCHIKTNRSVQKTVEMTGLSRATIERKWKEYGIFYQ